MKDNHLLKKTRADAKRDRNASKTKGGDYAAPTNPKKGRYGKRKTENEVSLREKITSAEKTCLLHGPGNSYEECKLLK